MRIRSIIGGEGSVRPDLIDEASRRSDLNSDGRSGAAIARPEELAEKHLKPRGLMSRQERLRNGEWISLVSRS